MLKYYCDVCGIPLSLGDAKIKMSTVTWIYSKLPNSFIQEDYSTHQDLWMHLCAEHKEQFLDSLVNLIKSHQVAHKKTLEEL